MLLEVRHDRAEKRSSSASPKLRLGVVPASTRSHGGEAQYSAAIMEALLCRGLPAGIESITVLTEGTSSPENGTFPGWQTVSLFPPQHPRRLLPVLRNVFGVRAVSWVGRQLRRSPAGSILFPVRERPEIGAWYRKHGFDFVFWTSSEPLAFECGMPFVIHSPRAANSARSVSNQGSGLLGSMHPATGGSAGPSARLPRSKIEGSLLDADPGSLLHAD